MKSNKLCKTIIALCCISTANSISAANITYEATDITDQIVGEDLWTYTYTVSDHTFNTDEGFSINFDNQLYSSLVDPTPVVNSDWDTLILQPDNLIPDNGVYDAVSLVNGATLVDNFMVSFVWTGNSSPSAQSYELYDSSFNITASGTTQSSISNVPVPPAIILMASGIVSLAGFKKRIKPV